jgi:hypothetical protein
MTSYRKIRRYTAYFRGWATAFGSHEKQPDDGHGLTWLFGEEQIGLILTPPVKRFLYPRFLGKYHGEPPVVSLTHGVLRIEDTFLRFESRDCRAFDLVMDLTRQDGDLHLYQTYHLVYPSGTRILTLSPRAPLTLVYHEISPLTLELC